VRSLQIEGIALTHEGVEACETIHSLYPELDDEGLLGIIFSLVKADPTLDYVRLSKGGPQALVTCSCKGCSKDIVMSLGWKGHIGWIETGLCALCRMKRDIRCQHMDTNV
jgi:hypothetical protein